MRIWPAVALLCACSGSGVPVRRAPSPTTPSDASIVTTAPTTIDASQDEQLAAIGFAMKQLDGAAHQCWAVAATERVDIEGQLVLQIAIPEHGQASVSLVTDTARNAKLAGCLTKVLVAYPWAPPLHGQTIQLPFKFTAPDGQSVIDRQLVSFAQQGKVAVAVLMDDANTGNAGASMFELRLAAGASTGLRRAGRSELWYFVDAGDVRGQGGATTHVAAGDYVYVRPGGAREIVATTSELRAMLVMTPGAKEGAARGGALPTPAISNTAMASPPIVLPFARAYSYPRGTGKVTIVAEPATIYTADLSASLLELPAGAKVPEHVHDKETELLYVLAGSGTMTVAGVELAVTPTSVVQVPPATKHSFTATSDFRAVQLYTPGGPEQRFKK